MQRNKNRGGDETGVEGALMISHAVAIRPSGEGGGGRGLRS